jgi:hypothetical protein
MTVSNVNVARSNSGSHRATDDIQFALRVATALLITTAAALVLVYAGLSANALPVDPDLLNQLY